MLFLPLHIHYTPPVKKTEGGARLLVLRQKSVNNRAKIREWNCSANLSPVHIRGRSGIHAKCPRGFPVLAHHPLIFLAVETRGECRRIELKIPRDLYEQIPVQIAVVLKTAGVLFLVLPFGSIERVMIRPKLFLIFRALSGKRRVCRLVTPGNKVIHDNKIPVYHLDLPGFHVLFADQGLRAAKKFFAVWALVVPIFDERNGGVRIPQNNVTIRDRKRRRFLSVAV